MAIHRAGKSCASHRGHTRSPN